MIIVTEVPIRELVETALNDICEDLDTDSYFRTIEGIVKTLRDHARYQNDTRFDHLFEELEKSLTACMKDCTIVWQCALERRRKEDDDQ